MVTSIIHLNVTRHKINEVAEQLNETDGVSEVYSVTGNHDLVAIVRVKSNDDLADLVTNNLAKVEGIEKTDTSWQSKPTHNMIWTLCFLFRCAVLYTNHALWMPCPARHDAAGPKRIPSTYIA